MQEVSGIVMKFINHLDIINSLIRNYYEMNPEDLAEYGLMDKPFFEQSISYLESITTTILCEIYYCFTSLSISN